MRVRDERAETRAAARLTHAELGHAETLLAVASESGKWELIRADGYPDERWRQYEGLFGRLLRGDEWKAVDYGYTCAQTGPWMITEAADDATRQTAARGALEGIRAARKVLAARADLHPRRIRLTRG